MVLSVTHLLTLSSLTLSALAGSYKLLKDIQGHDFLEESVFSFEAIPDPTQGRVNYVSRSVAEGLNLTFASKDTFILRADARSILSSSGPGRKSVRLKSVQDYKQHVAVFDIRHMPVGCGTWPAVWEVGENWPNNGEIDILEGVNDRGPNAATLHTSAGCTAPKGRPGQTGEQVQENCDAKVNGNVGCPVKMSDSKSYGPEFNAAGGGWYAVERSDIAINVWFWSRGSAKVPSAVKNGAKNVDPSTWGTPQAHFPSTSCNLNKHFGPQNIIINLTFCGTWAGNVFSSVPSCKEKGSCVNYVNQNPHAFEDAFFDFAAIRTYVPGAAAPVPPQDTPDTTNTAETISTSISTSTTDATATADANPTADTTTADATPTTPTGDTTAATDTTAQTTAEGTPAAETTTTNTAAATTASPDLNSPGDA
ncbi:concanavalin A-like lectin/glucanase domain-containing protein [Ephemerocybe angulata]|uniref:Concanavalin A-like lectin/glucanase domain-containing protein n=1 Tax=Ephemerocybe angulata TaxID=980116 RepID=A0A8H6M518_9AGAR|nr:concanavalin A-like lectin/glucanase domain-containing protein [Tulosesus angulatus]